MVWRKAGLAGERQHPATASNPSTKQGMEPAVSAPAPLLCHITPSKIAPQQGARPSATAQNRQCPCPCPWLGHGGPPEISQPHGCGQGGGLWGDRGGGDVGGEETQSSSQPTDSAANLLQPPCPLSRRCCSSHQPDQLQGNLQRKGTGSSHKRDNSPQKMKRKL